MSWYDAYPEYSALRPTLEQIDMDELQRQLNAAHEQNATLQRIIDEQAQTIRELHEQRDCNQRYMGINTNGVYDQL